MLRYLGKLALGCTAAFVGAVAFANTWAELEQRKWERRRAADAAAARH